MRTVRLWLLRKIEKLNEWLDHREDMRDIPLCNKLSASGHWSPFEHVAQPVETNDYIGNFRSWKQYRKEFESEAGGDR